MTRTFLFATAASLVLTLAACNKRNEKVTNNPELNVAISNEVLANEANAMDGPAIMAGEENAAAAAPVQANAASGVPVNAAQGAPVSGGGGPESDVLQNQ